MSKHIADDVIRQFLETDVMDPGRHQPGMPRDDYYRFCSDTPDPTWHDYVMQDPDPVARAYLAKNPHVRGELLTYMLNDPEPIVQGTALAELRRRSKDSGYHTQSIKMTGEPRPDFLQIKKPGDDPVGTQVAAAPSGGHAMPAPIRNPIMSLSGKSYSGDVTIYFNTAGLIPVPDQNLPTTIAVAISNHKQEDPNGYSAVRAMLEQSSQQYRKVDVVRAGGSRTWKDAKGKSHIRGVGKSIVTVYETGFTVVERDGEGFVEARWAAYQPYASPTDKRPIPSSMNHSVYENMQAFEASKEALPGELFGMRACFRVGGCDPTQRFVYIHKISDKTGYEEVLKELMQGGVRPGYPSETKVDRQSVGTIPIYTYRNGFSVIYGGEYVVWQS